MQIRLKVLEGTNLKEVSNAQPLTAMIVRRLDTARNVFTLEGCEGVAAKAELRR